MLQYFNDGTVQYLKNGVLTYSGTYSLAIVSDPVPGAIPFPGIILECIQKLKKKYCILLQMK